jgi:prepilin-type N-terminal cleavage/methylation domain-containing protein
VRVNITRARIRAFTIIEILMVVTIIGTLALIAIPRLARFIDQMNVNGAARQAASVIVTARAAAIAQSRHAAVHIDERRATIAAHIGGDTIVARNLGEMFGVTISATRDSMAYSPIGLGYGAANLRIIVRRGLASDSVVTSRVGRVRW